MGQGASRVEERETGGRAEEGPRLSVVALGVDLLALYTHLFA